MNIQFITSFKRLLGLAVMAGFAASLPTQAQNVMGGQDHTDVDLSYMAYEESQECNAVELSNTEGAKFEVESALPLPQNFKGHVIYDAEDKRLFGVLFGPPANAHRVSRVFEFDRKTGKVVEESTLPFVGKLGQAVYRDNHLYQPIPHESKIHKISVNQKNFGDIVASYDLPTILDLEIEEQELLRFTFIAFSGMSWGKNNNVIIHSEDLGELITVDLDSGKVLDRVATDRALRAIAVVPGGNSKQLLIANADPADARRRIEERRFMFRGIHGVHKLTPDCYPEGKRALHWELIDPSTGEVLARSNPKLTHLQAGSANFMKHEAIEGSKFGRYHFVTNGIDGIEFLSWEPTPIERESVSKL